MLVLTEPHTSKVKGKESSGLSAHSLSFDFYDLITLILIEITEHSTHVSLEHLTLTVVRRTV